MTPPLPPETAPADEDTRLSPVLDRIEADLPASLERLFELLRIPSISTDPAYAAECQRAADWLVSDLTEVGFAAERRAAPGHPMVVAKGGAPDAPKHLLFYGHYDVQPVDPLELWDTPPFEPKIETRADGSAVIRARGASDDKGQLMTFVEACRAWTAVHGALPCRITLFFEGEEEIGSPSLVPFMEEHADDLRADLALICDTGLYDAETPAIISQLRGLLGEELTITGPDRDLHSGFYGGPAQNPLRVMARLLAALHDADGRVTLAGFYDGVPETPAEIRASWDALGFDPEAFLGTVGLKYPAGEADRTAIETIWARPTCEINGVSGGYTGDGFKTVLPSQANAKVSFRLVGDQDPAVIREAFRAHVRAHLPADCTVAFKGHSSAPASRMDTSSPAFDVARRALTDEWGVDAAFVGAGGSIPVAGYFKTVLGMDALLAGWAKADDQIHSPNEKYDVESFRKGVRSWARILAALT
ncbi:MAG: M20/M25/M40 family metallo-hydrolase [Pseudomonadota bacterium]